MPRIAKNATRGLLGKRLTQALPDLGQITGSPTSETLEKERYAWLDAQNWQLGAQVSLVNVGVNLGFPTQVMFKAVTEAIGRDVAAAAETKLLQSTGSTMLDDALSDIAESGPNSQVFPRAIEAGVGTAVNVVAAAVPVVGWVLKIAWGIAKLFKRIHDMSKEKPEEVKVEYPASVFNPGADLDMANFILDLLENEHTNDWTRLYSPPGEPDFRYQNLENGGFRFIATASAQSGRAGFVPGTGVLHQAIETQQAQPGVYMPFDTGATLLPSARQQLLWWWKHIINVNSSSAFTIDTEECKRRWSDYLWGLHNFLWNVNLDLSKNAPATLKYLPWTVMKLWRVDSEGKPIFGWASPSAQPEDPTPKPKQAERAHYQPVRELEVLHKRQLAFCDTTTVAYVDESFAALAKRGTELWNKWDLRRRELLDHPAVCKLDLALIRDDEYRNEAIKRRKSHNCLVADVGLTWKIKPHRPPPSGSQGAAGVGDGPDDGDFTPRKAARWGGLAAAMAGLYLVLRKKA